MLLLGAGCASGNDGAGPGQTAAPGDFIPRPSGICPQLAPGMITVQAGGVARQARLWISEHAATLDGPLVLYWYGTNSTPAEAEQALGRDTIAAITAAGGLVVAPVHDPRAGFWPWYLLNGTQELDLQLADELVACAVEKVGIDRRRIHSVGFSAGAIQTVHMSYRRSGYIASVVTYSGSKPAATRDQDPANKLAAMIFHGGAEDRFVVDFQAGSEAYKADLAAAGRFALICNHGLGHRIPTDTGPALWRFLQDHRFGTGPSPYATTLPAELPRYCIR
jgi:poly(3-hydroxybutyrate) depolymerase